METVFVAFDEEDSAEANRLIKELRAQGFQVLTNHEVAGESQDDLVHRMRSAKQVYVIASEASSRSPVLQKAAVALQRASKPAQVLAVGSVPIVALPAGLDRTPPVALKEFIRTIVHAGPSEIISPPTTEVLPLPPSEAAATVKVRDSIAGEVMREQALAGRQQGLAAALMHERERRARITQSTAPKRIVDSEVVAAIFFPLAALAAAWAVEHGLFEKLWAWMLKTVLPAKGALAALPGSKRPDKQPEGDYLDFSLFAPKEMDHTGAVIQVVIYDLSTEADIERIIDTFDPKAVQHSGDESCLFVERYTKLQFTLEAPGLKCKRPNQFRHWRGAARALSFPVVPLEDTKEGVVFEGKVVVLLGEKRVGRLPFLIGYKIVRPEISEQRQGILPYEYAFASHASADRPKINPMLSIWKNRGEQFYINESVDTAETLNSDVITAIDRCDCFYLFWSHAAKSSPKCQVEFEHFDARLTEAAARGVPRSRLPDFVTHPLDKALGTSGLWPAAHAYVAPTEVSQDEEQIAARIDEEVDAGEGDGDRDISVPNLQAFVDRHFPDNEAKQVVEDLEREGWYRHVWGVERKIRWFHRLQDRYFRDTLGTPQLLVVPREALDIPGAGGDRRIANEIAFAIGRYPVTNADWDLFVSETARVIEPRGRPRAPVVHVSWLEAQQYVHWLSGKTGYRYRLLTAEEWEFACRAGVATEFATGHNINRWQANYDGSQTYRGSIEGERLGHLTDTHTYPANMFGAHDMHGNAWEWVSDIKAQAQHVALAKGGSFRDSPVLLRCDSVVRHPQDARFDNVGFRVARHLEYGNELKMN